MIITGVHGSIGVSPTRGPRSAPRHGASMTGVKGAIRWHYYTAAAIEGYTVSCTQAGAWSLTATVVLHDAFKLAQQPLVFAAMHTKKGLDGRCVVKSEWVWPITSMRYDRETHQLTARLGPPLETT